MKTCPKCGTWVRDEHWQCRNCQTVLSEQPSRLSGRWLGLAAIALVLIILSWPFWPRAQELRPTRRNPCKNSLHEIGLALHNYHDTYRSFPPAYVADEQGRPMHSWRVLILPFLDSRELYDRYDFSVPWNHANNRYVLEHMPKVYSCYMDPDRGKSVTSYFAPFGPNCVFEGPTPTGLRDMTDGTTSTVLVGEAIGLHVPWTKPEDVDVTQFPRLGEPGGFSSGHEGGLFLLLGDGSARFVNSDLDEKIVRFIFTRSDGNFLPDF